MPNASGTTSQTSSLAQRISERLDGLRSAQLLRALSPPRGIDLSSNDYLSLSRHPLLQEKMIEGVRRDGCGSTGSRLLRGQRESFDEVERAFARFKRAERALYFSSGYLANLAVMTTFAEAGDRILSDERNHASLIDGIRLSAASRRIFAHNDTAALASLLDETSTGHTFVVIESLNSMEGDVAPLSEIASLCRKANATLIVDEAHAVGIFGGRGSGLVEASGIEPRSVLTINTAGKALGVAGAFVCGPSWAIDYLVQRARPFIFSTAPPPAIAGALIAAIDIVVSEPGRRGRLAQLVMYLRAHMAARGIPAPGDESPIIPIVVGDNGRALAIAATLQNKGFDVRAIRPPTVPDRTARLRVTVNTSLDEPTLDRFVEALAVAIDESCESAAADLRPLGTTRGEGR